MINSISKIYSIFLGIVCLLFYTCGNDIKEVQLVNASKETPDESMTEVTMVYTDNGIERAILRSPVIYKYGLNQSRTEFPKGLTVDFFDKNGKKESYMESKYGVFNEISHQLILQNKVQMINFVRQDTLDTEYLVWKQDSAIVTTEQHYFFMHGVKGKSQGHFFRARENFTKYTWKKVKGEYYYNQTDSL